MERKVGARAVHQPRDMVGEAAAFAVMSGGLTVLAGLSAASLWIAAHAVRNRRPPMFAVLGVAGLSAYLTLIRPWTRSWGTTGDEAREPLPGDELVTDPAVSMTRAVTIDAPVEGVWPWLAQMGQDRGGFYSYTWLENPAGCHMHNADRVHPDRESPPVRANVAGRRASPAGDGCRVPSVREDPRLRTRVVQAREAGRDAG